MKRISVLAAFALLPLSSAWAAQKSVTLAVPGMTCPTCPITIKKALLKQQGVANVIVLYQKKELRIAYDDAKTSPKAIMKATASVGFPSTVTD